MYERFTDSARSGMQFANREAQRLNHEYIGPEHLLLGLVGHMRGIAAEVLRACGFNLENARNAVAELVGTGPDMLTMGKLPLAPRAKEAVEFAIEEARDLQSSNVDTEHLLLGLVRERETVGHILAHFQVTPEDVRERCLQLMRRREPKPTPVTAAPQVPAGEARFILELSPDAVHAFRTLQELSGRTSLEDTLLTLVSVCLPSDASIRLVRVAPAESKKKKSRPAL